MSNIMKVNNLHPDFKKVVYKEQSMYINLAGEWNLSLEADEGRQSGKITLPGTLQAAGYGNPITKKTPWVSALHDTFWYEQEEYKFAQEEGVNVPFLSQPPRHFLGQAVYERSIDVPEESAQEWYFHAELARWRSKVWVDGEFKGEDCTLCGPHDINLGCLSPGRHTLRILLDNSMIYPYRPDAHGVSDALGGTWNGMVGEIALFTEDVSRERKRERERYAQENPRTVEVQDGCFYIDGHPTYFRATHFGGEYPLTGYPSTDKSWWLKLMSIIKEWGLNGIRFHSYCPPEAAFAAADEAGVYLLVECGMWNHFSEGPEGREMYELLCSEAKRMLEYFGHHPSFVFFSPTNEPSGGWYRPLQQWVSEIREYDRLLGYGSRRIYTAQSGWPYDVPSAEVQGVDFLYFHRSGPTSKSMTRGKKGWKGKDYSGALEGVTKPVICHELGQICAYPDYHIISKYTGFLQPSNYKVFRENARANGILPYAESFVKCSGENQVRLYKEELEANFRTPQLQGFELLDLHDYLGQGTALVGILDAFWENKGYGDPARFREYCGDTVILARISSYIWKNTDRAQIPVEVCHYGREEIEDGVIHFWLLCGDQVLKSGELPVGRIAKGGNTNAGIIQLDIGDIRKNAELTLRLELESEKVSAKNSWNLYVFVREAFIRDEFAQEEFVRDELVRKESVWGGDTGPLAQETQVAYKEDGALINRDIQNAEHVKAKESHIDAKNPTELGISLLYTRDWEEAKKALEAGGRVVYAPWLSDLGFESPALSGRSVSWNSQMGPTWCRTMGIVVQESHPIFRHFPTRQSGGWQWENILENARGFHMAGLEQIRPIVQPIDDWNRNLLQSMIFEAKAGKGRLLLVSANLDASFEESPERYSLRQAILAYAASEEFCPEAEVDFDAIESKLFPMLRMDELTENVTYGKGCTVRDGDAVTEADPGTSARITRADFPVEIIMTLKSLVAMKGFVYVPEQRDRSHEGFAREYRLEIGMRQKSGFDQKMSDMSKEPQIVDNRSVAEAINSMSPTLHWETASEGVFLNTCRSQQILFDNEIKGDIIRLTILSAYGCEDKLVWEQGRQGWQQVFQPKSAIVQIAGFHILCNEKASHGDVYSKEKDMRSRTKEIDF